MKNFILLMALPFLLLSCNEGPTRKALIEENQEYFLKLNEGLKELQPKIIAMKLDSLSGCIDVPFISFNNREPGFNADFLCEDRIGDWMGSYGEGLGEGQTHFIPSKRLVWTMRSMLEGVKEYDDYYDDYFDIDVKALKNLEYLIILNEADEFVNSNENLMNCYIVNVKEMEIICGFQVFTSVDKDIETYVEVTTTNGVETSNRGVVSSMRSTLSMEVKKEIERVLKESYNVKFVEID